MSPTAKGDPEPAGPVKTTENHSSDHLSGVRTIFALGLAGGFAKSSPVDLAYNIADAINKIGFGLVVYSIAKNATANEKH